MKKLFLLSLIVLAPGCIGKFKRKTIVSSAPLNNVIQDQAANAEYNYINPIELQNYDEDLDAFVLEDDESGFEDIINNNIQINSSQELTLVQDESGSSNLGDPYYNSAAYGLKNIYYDFGRTGVKQDQTNYLDDNIKIIKNLIDKNYTIVLAGHACDTKGSSYERNMTISSERPQIIADKLVASGIDSKNIKVVGWGSEMKIVPFGDKLQQAPNRRVEFYAYPPGAQN